MHTIADPLKRAMQIAPGKTAVIDEGRSINFAQLHERCCKLIGMLNSLGMQRGDRIAILAGNSQQYIETYIGVPAGGFVLVPLNTRHCDAELEYVLEDSGARLLLVDRAAGSLVDKVERCIALNDEYDKLVEGADALPLGAQASENDLAGLFYTGGTTGAAKGVMLSHRNLIANTFNWLTAVPPLPADRFLSMAPMFHAAGSSGLLGNVWTATCQITLANFDPGKALDLIEKHAATQTLGVPAMLAAIAEEQFRSPRDTSSLRTIAHGGSPIATEVARRTKNAFPSASLIEGYGTTELSPLVTIFVDEDMHLDDPRIRSCGQPVLGNEVFILDENGSEVAPGEVGEVVVRGSNVMLGYWNKPDATAEVLKDGRYWTGDLGYMDDEGYLYLVDRSKDMIVSGGENVYSTEVEEVIYQHPDVLEAAVFGVPDDVWGEAVHAVVVPRHNEVDPDDIIQFCRGKITGFKVPKAIDIRSDPLPKSGPGKVLKRELRAPYWEGRDRAVN